MDNNTQQILELLKWYNSDDLKQVQIKFTKTANTIKKEAINSRLNVLYTKKELETLSKAAVIFGDMKLKIEHAKEVKRREEQRLQRLDEGHEKQEEDIINKHVNLKSMADCEVLIMYCCVNDCVNLNNLISRDIDMLHKYPSRLKGTISGWRRDIFSALKEKFQWRVNPTEEIITDFLRGYKLKDRRNTYEQNKNIIERFNTLLAVLNGDNITMLNNRG